MSTTHPAHDAVVELLRRDLDQAEYDEIRSCGRRTRSPRTTATCPA